MTQAQDRPGNRGRIGWLRLALALALLGGAGQPTAQAQSAPATNLVFHALSQADAETVREMVAGVLGESGRVWVDRAGNRLIVEAPPDRQALVAQLVRELDVPPLNIRIEVRLSSREQAGERGVGVGGRGRSAPTGRGRVTQVDLRARARDQRSEQRDEVLQILLVGNGREGALRVGESVPYLEWIQEFGRRIGLYQSEIRWQEVGAFLTVQPQVVGRGPGIRLKITPELRGLVDRNPLRVRYTAVTTEVLVNDGQTVDLGGLDGHRDFYGRFLVGLDNERNARELTITLTPRLMSHMESTRGEP